MINSSRKKNLKRRNSVSPLSYALRLLSRKDYSVYEIKEKLLSRNYTEEEIENTIKKLLERDLLNDMRYAERIIKKYAFVKRYGYLKVRNELFKRGLKYEEVLQLLDSLYTEEDEKRNAFSLISKRPPDKIANYLLGKGYRAHIVREILAEPKQ